MSAAAAPGRSALLLMLVVLGMGWGITPPLAKIAVSGGYRAFGIIFWQSAIGAVLLFLISTARGRGLPRGRRQIGMCVVIALIGTLLPNAASYRAAVHLPAGIMSILLSLVPIFAFPIALAMATDRFEWRRLAGILCGALGVVLIAGPETGLPDPAMLAFVPLALLGPLFYGLEGNIVGKWGMVGMDPIQLLLGASVISALLTAPLALAAGQWISPLPPYGAADLAVMGSAVVNALVYAGYVWLVSCAGAVFAAQVSYLVTGFGVLWSVLLLQESYSGWVWAALAVMLAGLFLVQPRPNSVLVRTSAVAKDTV
ncbi:DMT family transporter [Actibacterium sp. D379-3]